MAKIINIIFFGVSIVAYYYSPKMYSLEYVSFLMVLFLLQTVVFIKCNNFDKYINFHTIFLISFFVSVFLYPVFIYPKGITFIQGVIDSQINKGTALCQLTISAYMLGAMPRGSITHKKIEVAFQYIRLPQLLYNLYLLFVTLSIMDYMYYIGKTYSEVERNGPLSSMVYIIYSVCVLLNSSNNRKEIQTILDFYKLNRKYMIPIALYVGILLAIGVRSLVLEVLLSSLAVLILFVRRINSKFILTCGLGIIALFFVLMMVRNGGDISTYYSITSSDIPFFFYIVSDLICICRPLYAGLEYVSSYGLLHGASFVPQLFAPIPLMPTFIASFLYGKNSMQLTTQYILSDYSGTVGIDDSYFIGTQCVVDLYMNFGLILCVIGFYLFGSFMRYIVMKRNNSISYSYTYLVMLSCSVFLVRDALYSPFRSIIWGLLLIVILKPKRK